MNRDSFDADVIVIGGGPAGSTTAAVLAKMGHSVILFEKEKFPRDHVGESLLPFCYTLLRDLGVLDQLKSKFVRKPGVRFVKSDGESMTTWCFNRVIHDESYLSFQVTRAEFDQILLENAHKQGAVVHEETRVTEVDLDSPDGLVRITAVGPQGTPLQFCARFLVDASGRSSLIATQRGWRNKFEGLDRTALWTHWKVPMLSAGLEEGLSLIVYLGGDKKGWIWLFPLSRDRLTVGVVLENTYIREQRQKLALESGEYWTKALYDQEVMASVFARTILSEGEMIADIRVEGDYSYFVDQAKKYGSRYALIGDASTFIDPIFSSGIYLAMKSSNLVSKAVHQILTSTGQQDIRPLSDAYQKINGAYQIIHNLIRSFYNPLAISFAEAGTAAKQEHLLHEDAMAAGHYLLSGDFFENAEYYQKFIDSLQNPNTYRRFKKSVIARREFIAESCEVNGKKIFPARSGVD